MLYQLDLDNIPNQLKNYTTVLCKIPSTFLSNINLILELHSISIRRTVYEEQCISQNSYSAPNKIAICWSQQSSMQCNILNNCYSLPTSTTQEWQLKLEHINIMSSSDGLLQNLKLITVRSQDSEVETINSWFNICILCSMTLYIVSQMTHCMTDLNQKHLNNNLNLIIIK